MPRQRPHTHPCAVCKAPVSCEGEWEQNYDGWPEAICSDYHLPGGTVADVRCEDQDCIEVDLADDDPEVHGAL